MVVQHNMQAANASRMLNVNVSALSKSTEKLSSGYRINRAADDAAGLSISEKMRKQIRGLTQASSNAEDGISAVQTAEGALTEVHSMLQRMNELAVQAANGTYTSADIESISKEVAQLSEEITRITSTTDFNGINMFTTSIALFVGYTAASLNTLSIGTIDSAKFNLVSSIDSNDDAKAKLSLIASAIAAVSAERSKLGAIQNRLEHTVDNLDNVVENVTTAESSIRDTDMASEMVNYSKYSILQSAGQSMLAQANSANQGVLSLLQ